MSVTVIVGDPHLGKGLNIGKPNVGNTPNSRIIDQFNLLDWVLEQTIKANGSTIILAGDICEDVKPDYMLMEFFIEWLKKCQINYIEVHIISGNHDLKRTGTRLSSYLDLISTINLPNIHIYKNTNTIFNGNVGFTLLPYRDRQSLEASTNSEAINKISAQLPYEASCIPNNYSKVLIGHLALEGSIFVGDEFDNSSKELMCPLSMFKEYEYVWMGHVHKPQVLKKKPHIAHVGSLDISDFGETNHTKNIIVFDTNLPEKFYKIDVPSRPLCRIIVDVPEGFDATNYVLDKIEAIKKQQPLDKAIVRVEIKLLDENSESSDKNAIEKAIYNLGAFYVCAIQESKNVSIINTIQNQIISNKIDPKKAIEIFANTQIEFQSDNKKQEFIRKACDFVDEFDSKK